MGKGNRSRTNRATEIIANAAPKTTKQTGSKAVTWVVVALVALLLIACIVISASVNNGWFQRSKTALKSDNYKISGTMLSYYVYTYYNQVYSSYATMLGIDTGVPLDAQYYDSEKTMTWYDSLASTLAPQLKQTLALCEGAKKAGVKLDDKDTKSIDDSMKAMEEAALQYGYSPNGFCAAQFGTGVSEKDVRSAMELNALAMKYGTILSEEKLGEVTDAEMDEFYKNNPESFLTADTMQYSFDAKMTPAGAEATEEEKKKYEDDKAAMLAKANELKEAAKDEASFKAWLADYLLGDSAEALFDADYNNAAMDLAEADKPSEDVLKAAKASVIEYLKKLAAGEDATAPTWGDAKYADALDEVCANMKMSIVTNGIEAAKVEAPYGDPAAEDATDAEKWLFAENRAAKDVTVITADGDLTTKYTVILVNETASRDESATVSVGHILFTGAKYGYDDNDTTQNPVSDKAKAKAEEVLAQFNAGAKTLDAFKALGEEYTEDSSVVYENVIQGTMVSSFDEWIFDSARKAGDTDIVATEYGYHIIYFIGEGLPAWKATAQTGVASEKINTWYEDAYKTFNVTVNNKIINENAL